MFYLNRLFKKFLSFVLIFSLASPSYGSNDDVSVQDLDTLSGLQTYNLPRGQHVAFFDIDGVLLSEGAKDKNNADVLSSDTANHIRSLQANGVMCFALTARQNKLMVDTFQKLSDYGINFNHPSLPIDFLKENTRYYKGIISSPNIHYPDGKVSTKFETLEAFVGHLMDIGQTVSHVSFVDNEAFHFESSINITQSLDLYHYQRQFEPLYSTKSDKAPCLSNLEFLEIKSGGSGGVVIFVDPNTGQKWTVKSWNNKNHGINECLAAMLYQKMGAHSPDFYLYNDLPVQLKGQVKGLHEGGLYRVARFIEGAKPSEEELKENAENAFIATSLLSFWDVKPDNFILTENNELHFIDTGGSLLYRALGQPKVAEAGSWTKHQISELMTLRSANTLGGKYFENISDDQIKEQIKNILSHSDLIIKEAKNFCRSLRYEDTHQLLHSLESRLQHLRFLDHYFEGKISRKADPFALASVNDGAGTLLYTTIDSKPHILLGKRVRHNWWGNLGGKVDAGETFYEAASRETKEESGGHFNFKDQIMFSPSHDMVTIEDNLMLRRFRTYLREVDYISPEELMDKLQSSSYATEYTEFKWVPAEEVLEVYGNTEDHLYVEENQETIRCGDTILHPPFAESLKQPEIKEWLFKLTQGKEIEATCTQSVAGHQELEVIDDEEVEHSSSKGDRFTLWLTTALQNKKVNAPVSPIMNFEAQTASHSMLNVLSSSTDEEDTVQKIMKVVINNSNTLQIDETRARMIEYIINQEKVHSDKTVLYHGLEAPIWFSCRVLSHIRHMLDGSAVQTDVLRSLDSYFDEYQNANDLLNFILEGKNNYSDGFKRAGISCNPTLLSNLQTQTSCTLDYFFGQDNQRAPKDPIVNIIKSFFDAADISADDLISDLQNIYAEFFGDETPGALLQIFLDPKVVDQACYIAGSAGAVVEDSNGEVVRQPLPVLDALKTGQNKTGSEIEKLQVRLLGDLAKYPHGSVIVKDYFSDGKNGTNRLDQSIKNALSPYLYELTESLSEKKGVYNREPNVVNVASKIKDIRSFEKTQLDNEVVKSVKEKNYVRFLRLALESPIDLNMTYTDPDSLKTIKLELDSALPTVVYSIAPLHQSGTLDNSYKEAFVSAVIEIIREDATAHPLANSVRVLSSLKTKEEIERFLSAVALMTRDDMKGRCVTNIAQALAKVEEKERENVASIVAHLTSNNENIDVNLGYGVVSIIQALALIKTTEEGERSVISAAAHLLNDNMSEREIENVLKAIAVMEAGERESVVSAAAHLVNNNMNGRNIADMLIALVKIGSEERESVVSSTIKLIHENMDAFDIINITNTISQVRLEERESVVSATIKLIRENIPGVKLVFIINALAAVEAEERESLCSVLRILMSGGIATKNLNYIIELLSEIDAKEREDFSSALVKIMTRDMVKYEIKSLFQNLSKIEANERESVASIASDLIRGNITEYWIGDLIEALAKPKPEERESIASSTKILIRDNMEMVEIISIFERLTAIDAKERGSVAATVFAQIRDDMKGDDIVALIQAAGLQ